MILFMLEKQPVVYKSFWFVFTGSFNAHPAYPSDKMHPSNVVLQIGLCVRCILAFFTGKLLFWSFSCMRFLVVVQSSSCLQRLVTYFAGILLAAKFFGEVHFMITKMKQNEPLSNPFAQWLLF